MQSGGCHELYIEPFAFIKLKRVFVLESALFTVEVPPLNHDDGYYFSVCIYKRMIS